MPMPDEMGRDNDLVLPPNTFAYVLDTTKGKVSAYVGPGKTSLSNTDQLVTWDPARRKFIPTNDNERAVLVFQTASEGQYVVLSNPATENVHPPLATTSEAVTLEVGRQVNVPGPVSFPLWPGQVAQTIDGHHLRHNQYLLVRVYDAEQARLNAASAVIATTGDEPTAALPAAGFTMGQLIVVAGTDVSFYIPPTGIEVVPEDNGQFVREAVTLERLEYCILLDENGEKRYVQGPDVVFPRPTEKFVQENGSRKFRATELNPHSGLYIKVIADYEDDDGVQHYVGEELFITGTEQAIYFPRPEHSIITYDDKQRHHAIAIPAGEGRYVLNRDTGEVDLVTGPKMFLPDPRTQVVVLRVLDPDVVELLYPGNDEALTVNEGYRALTTTLTPGEHLSNRTATAARSIAVASYAGTPDFAGDPAFGDVVRRRTTYTPPRSVVLDTKYDGAVAIDVWPGYAILVTNKTGQRRVEVGPKMVLLQYDEMVMPLALSTGRPKDDVDLLRTCYLRVVNNQVSDRVTVETRDLVRVTIDIGYRVNFEGDTDQDEQRWFAVENYVKVLTDHGRSRLRNAAKRHSIQSFYGSSIDIVRDVILGDTTEDGRPGLVFAENGMRVYDVEVLNVAIEDPNVASLLIDAQGQALTGAIELSLAEEEAEKTKKLESLKRGTMEELDKTAKKAVEVRMAQMEREIEREVAGLEQRLRAMLEEQRLRDLELSSSRQLSEQQVALQRLADEQRVELLIAETTEAIRRIQAVDPTLIAALNNLGDRNFVEQLVGSLGPAALAAGTTTADLFGQIFKDTPFEGMFTSLAERPLSLSANTRD